jgi:hypothetical protein
VKHGARSPIPLPVREHPDNQGWDAPTRTTVATREVVAVPRAAGGDEGMSVAAARRIAERAHRGQLDANGEPYIAHVGRVAAGVPLFARPVGWLHDVLDCSGVDETGLVAAGASPDERVALCLLRCREGERTDGAFLEQVRVIAHSPGESGRIARAVKRADLLDHVSHRAARSAVWSPPYGAALVALMIASAGPSQASGAPARTPLVPHGSG